MLRVPLSCLAKEEKKPGAHAISFLGTGFLLLPVSWQGKSCAGFWSDNYRWIKAALALWPSAVSCLQQIGRCTRGENSHLCDLQSSAICLQYSYWVKLVFIIVFLSLLAGNPRSRRSANYFCFIWRFLGLSFHGPAPEIP